MQLKKYQKEYDRYEKYTRKAYNILKGLYNEIKNNNKLKQKKDMSFVLSSMEKSMLNFLDIINDVRLVDFSNIEDISPKNLNNLVILPLFQDEDIYVDLGRNISDIFNNS